MTLSQAVAEIVSVLGDPPIEAADIEWVEHLPAGKQLLQWLADQCPDEVDSATALRDIALEHEEVQLCVVPFLIRSILLTNNTASLQNAKGSPPPIIDAINSPPATYLSPSRLQ